MPARYRLTRVPPGRWSRFCAVAVACVALVGVGAGAPPALAAEPTGEFAPFAQCPLSDAELSACLVASTSSGELVVGNRTVPIEKTITLQGGFEEEAGVQHFVGAANGETLSKTPEVVPGGLLNVMCGKLPLFLKALCESFERKGITAVHGTVELAAPATSIGLNEENLLAETGTALSLPVKVKLENLFLGSNCYVGSNASPIEVNLTTGETHPPEPNKPIKGKLGTEEVNPEGNILTINNDSLVNNTFAAPGSSGCGGIFSFLVDPVVNSSLGIPAASGHNTVILNGTLKQAGAAAVREH